MANDDSDVCGAPKTPEEATKPLAANRPFLTPYTERHIKPFQRHAGGAMPQATTSSSNKSPFSLLERGTSFMFNSYSQPLAWSNDDVVVEDVHNANLVPDGRKLRKRSSNQW